jgi:hypothetical protein
MEEVASVVVRSRVEVVSIQNHAPHRVRLVQTTVMSVAVSKRAVIGLVMAASITGYLLPVTVCLLAPPLVAAINVRVTATPMTSASRASFVNSGVMEMKSFQAALVVLHQTGMTTATNPQGRLWLHAIVALIPSPKQVTLHAQRVLTMVLNVAWLVSRAWLIQVAAAALLAL